MTKVQGPEWEQVKAQRLESILSAIERLRANDQPGLRHFRHGSLHGRINELRIVGLFTPEEARDLSQAANAANLAAYQALKAAGTEPQSVLE
ncbi:hypothetical protein [Pseudomonas monteilii]|uniref:hypothetical protein n=1 Tax=Pseudomonas monteilii TaxID=76759 RepID=UPI003F6DEF8D